MCGTRPSFTDRRPALRSILRSLLVTYSKLLSALLAPPPTSSSEGDAEWKQQLEWINILAQNIMAAANDLRPVQARGNLELMMRRQLELRREDTKAIHSCVLFFAPCFHARLKRSYHMCSKCDSLEAQLAELRQAAQGVGSASSAGASHTVVPVRRHLSYLPYAPDWASVTAHATPGLKQDV